MKRLLRTSLSRTLKVGRLNHIAIATPDLESSSSFYRDILGADVADPIDLPDHGVSVVFVGLENTKLELVHPYGDDSPLEGFLAKNANGGVHHMCIEVEDIDVAIQDMLRAGIRLLNEEPKLGAHNKPIVFLHPADTGGVLIEMEQK